MSDKKRIPMSQGNFDEIDLRKSLELTKSMEISLEERMDMQKCLEDHGNLNEAYFDQQMDT